MLKNPTWILSYGPDDVHACTVMAWLCPSVLHEGFVLYPLHKFRRTLSFSYWWIWQFYVRTSYHILSEDYICIRRLYFCLFSLYLYAGFNYLFVWSDINHIYNTHQDEKLYKYVANFCKAKNGCGNLRELRCHMNMYCTLLYLPQYNDVIAIWFGIWGECDFKRRMMFGKYQLRSGRNSQAENCKCILSCKKYCRKICEMKGG